MANTDGSRVEELLTVIAKATLAPVLREELADERMAKLYEMTGNKTAEDARKTLKIAKATVIDTWKRWEMLGLVVKNGKSYRKVF